jgi:septal ring factor EnvC (AmiA/AmiB activator)
LPALATVNQDIDDQEQALSDIKRRLAEARSRTAELKSQEKNILAQLEHTAEEVELTRQVLTALKNKEARLDREVRGLGERLLAAESQLARQTAVMETRVREIFKRGRLNEWEVLVSSGSLSDIARRYKYLSLISDQDQRLCRSIEGERALIVRDKADLEEKLVIMAQVKGETELEMANLRQDEEKQKKLLDKVRREKSSKEALAKDLQDSAKKLQKLLEDLERKRKAELAKRREPAPLPGTTYIEKNRGGLGWPVDGTLYSEFGPKMNTRYNTVIQNNGIDIKSQLGAPVRTVAGGKVVYAERFLGYGRVILIDHYAGLYTLYGNLGALYVDAGAQVVNNQVIATLGSGIDGPILHFEVRKGGKPVDPLEWLGKRR